jgi:dolichol-phosphate mannosyltransferase
MFDEEAVLPIFEGRLRPVLDALTESYEVVAVDDGSSDGTESILGLMRRGWPELRVVRLRRNVGHQAALTAGIDRCRGDIVITLDADLQDPPELIPVLLAAAREADADVVYAVREDRASDSWFKRNTAAIYYRLMRRAAGGDVPRDAGDFRLMTRPVVDALRGLPERHRVYRLLIPWLGFPSTTVNYRRERRAAGQSKYPISKMARLAVDSLTSFTAMPLRVATWAGVVGSGACLIMVIVAVVAQLMGATVPGWASVFVAVFFLGAVQLLCLGLLGEYVGRLYSEAQSRPLYFVGSDSADTDDQESADRD